MNKAVRNRFNIRNNPGAFIVEASTLFPLQAYLADQLKWVVPATGAAGEMASQKKYLPQFPT